MWLLIGGLATLAVQRLGRRRVVVWRAPPDGVAVPSSASAERKLRAELKRALQSADAHARTKTEFLANMSHEIRTPLAGIVGMTRLLLDTSVTSEQREYVETIRASGEGLLAIVDDILEFSNAESGKLVIRRAPFELGPCLAGALEGHRTVAEGKGLSLSWEIDPTLPGVVHGDVTRVAQVLDHLVSNAVKFTEAGAIDVRVSWVGKDRGGGVAFCVRDTGIGIPKDRLDRLFPAFQQVDASMSRRYGGTGLGLTLAKRLVELMGGELSVESREGEGSVFRFVLPLTRSQDRADATGAKSLVGRRLLVVDDSERDRTELVRQASSWGLTARVASSATRALELVDAGEAFDVVVTSLGHAEAKGIDLARALRERSPTNAPPVVLLSAVGSTDLPGLSADSTAAEDGLFAEILTKPVRGERLREVLLRLAGSDAEARASEARPSPARPDPSLASRIPLRILLAEDNRINQKVALRMLKQLGYRADVAANGEEVLVALREQAYDLILMDVQMPELDGLEATRRIRGSLPRAEQPRIVALTANAMEKDREACREAGMDDYIAKPLGREALAEALERCASGPETTETPRSAPQSP